MKYIRESCDVSLCGGRMCLKILVRDSSKMWKPLKSESDIIFAYPFMYWECSYTSLLMRV